jgi:hypothetical protein
MKIFLDRQEKKIKRDKPLTRIIRRHRQEIEIIRDRHEMKIDHRHRIGTKTILDILMMKTVLRLHRETRLLT